MDFEQEIETQRKELDKIKESYDKWEENLDEAELLLFKYQDMIESFNKEDQNVDQLIQDLEANYTTLEKEVSELEDKYPISGPNKASIYQADEVLNLLRKLNSEIDNLNDSPYMKSVNSQISQLKLISDVLS